MSATEHKYYSSPYKGLTYTFATLQEVGVYFAHQAARAKENKGSCRTMKDKCFQDGMARAYEEAEKLLRAMQVAGEERPDAPSA